MKKLIVANWKMQLSVKASLELAKKLVRQPLEVSGMKGAKAAKSTLPEIVICPDYTALPFVGPILKSTAWRLGAQDSAVAEQGALTGEVSPANLRALGVEYVILGHSERREHLHENSAIINAKLKAALAVGLTPILCVGEKLTERKAGRARAYIFEELRQALKGIKIKTAADLAIAYEPIWAISSNRGAKPMLPEEAAEIQKFIKTQTTRILKKSVRVLYGGSVDENNAGRFLAQADVDGLLIGGASLRPAIFKHICRL